MKYESICNFTLLLAAGLLVVFLATCDDSHKNIFASALGLVGGLWVFGNLVRIFAEKIKNLIDYFGGF